MKSFTYVLTDPEGLHARPAVTISQTCVQLQSAVTFTYNGKTASGNNVLQLLALGAKEGAELTVTIEGPDEEEAIVSLEAFFSAK